MYVIYIHCIYLKTIVQQNSFCFQRGHSKFDIIVLKQDFVFYPQLSPRSGLGLYVEINSLGLIRKVRGMVLYTPIVFLFTMICNISSARVILLDCILFYLLTILYEMKIDLGGDGEGGARWGGDAFATRLCNSMRRLASIIKTSPGGGTGSANEEIECLKKNVREHQRQTWSSTQRYVVKNLAVVIYGAQLTWPWTSVEKWELHTPYNHWKEFIQESRCNHWVKKEVKNTFPNLIFTFPTDSDSVAILLLWFYAAGNDRSLSPKAFRIFS